MSNTSKQMPTRNLPCGGYEYLHPTKGWKRISGKRLEAQGALQRFYGSVQRQMLSHEQLMALQAMLAGKSQQIEA